MKVISLLVVLILPALFLDRVAEAASCRKNVRIENSGRTPMKLVSLSSRTRGAPWRIRNLRQKTWLKRGEAYRGTVEYTVFGCKTKRQVQITYACDEKKQFQQVYNRDWHKPRDLKLRLSCDDK